ncbi:hypothetical protein TRIUR3_25904 [Triticum urartu]|uniref:Ubiquitin-like domain-containing protein n=1 Tax=Triticum urartu TaxID=4572 RepID=M7ZK31_TRIUA|nr:hypothetical protein TRIUR3_25904 [Triticum urartu]
MGNAVAVSRSVQISVMTTAGKVLALDVRTTDTIGHVKKNIHREARAGRAPAPAAPGPRREDTAGQNCYRTC